MIIPDDILAAEAAGRIPSGVSLEYLAGSRDKSAIAGIIFMICFTGLLMIVRLYARAFIVKKIGLDDALAVVTLMLYIAFAVLSIILINLGSGRHIEYIQYVLSLPTVRDTEILDFTAHILYTTALFLCRLSGLAFYYRLSVRSTKLHLIILVAAPLLFAAFLPQIFLLIFHCKPVTGLWPYEWQVEPKTYTCLSWGLVYSVNSGLSLACDMMMFVIPAALIKGLHVSLEKKIKLSFVMFPGILVIMISAVRVWLVAEGQWDPDGSWAYNPMMCVENAEIAATLVALSVPALKPVFGNLFARLTEYNSSHTRSRSTKVHSLGHSKTVGTGAHSSNRDSKRLINWSKIGKDDYEMMPSEVSLSRAARGGSRGSDHSVEEGRNGSRSPGIRVTNEVNIVRDEEIDVRVTKLVFSLAEKDLDIFMLESETRDDSLAAVQCPRAVVVIKLFNFNIYLVIDTMASRPDPISQAFLPETPRPHLKVDLDTPISELLSCYGDSHIHFPKSLKQYYELDSATLDSLIVFFHQFRPHTTETRRYPTTVNPWLTYDYKEGRWYTEAIDIESKRCRFGEFIGLTNELVDPSLPNPRIWYAERDKSKESSSENPSGAGVVQNPKKRRDKTKLFFFAWLVFGK
ncbi:hypothetical protein PITC_034180 [Penicillium italicum]|uniref:Rhodopsin domain-containing protein n=1 Tax=Penicillium italicum TaxID=40296 RepID=A0A0A2LG92_PENIT|nr:hypothetical protein PITC_034180 [Penicillium italicum]